MGLSSTGNRFTMTEPNDGAFKEYLDSRGCRFDLSERLNMYNLLLSTLESLHLKKTAYCDVSFKNFKPVLFENKIKEFKLKESSFSQEDSYCVGGDTEFISPEALTALKYAEKDFIDSKVEKEFGYSSDLYSLAIMILEIETGCKDLMTLGNREQYKIFMAEFNSLIDDIRPLEELIKEDPQDDSISNLDAIEEYKEEYSDVIIKSFLLLDYPFEAVTELLNNLDPVYTHKGITNHYKKILYQPKQDFFSLQIEPEIVKALIVTTANITHESYKSRACQNVTLAKIKALKDINDLRKTIFNQDSGELLTIDTLIKFLKDMPTYDIQDMLFMNIQHITYGKGSTADDCDLIADFIEKQNNLVVSELLAKHVEMIKKRGDQVENPDMHSTGEQMLI